MKGNNYSLKQKSTKRIWLLATGFVLLVMFGVFMTMLDKEATQEAPQQHNNDKAERAEAAAFSAVHGRYMFSGTVVPARAVENEARRPDGTVDYSQPFSKFDTFNPEQYDAWLMDFECPMTVNDIPYRTQVQNTVFNCPDEFAPELAKYFTFANVANNHTRDQGDDEYEETVRHLEVSGMQTIGHWDPREKDEICEVVALPVRVQKTAGGEEAGTLPVAFCAWHYFEKDPQPEEFAVMDAYAEVMPVFAFVQVGVEYRDSADQKQISIAHTLIDEHDPEFVIQNSAHWVQDTEAYKGKLVVYSTGNFIFDQLDTETNRGLSIATDMTIPYDDNVKEWLSLGKTCEPRGDNCLELAKELGLKKVDVKLSYEPVASTTGYRQLTQKAGPEVQAAIEARAKWAETMKGLE